MTRVIPQQNLAEKAGLAKWYRVPFLRRNRVSAWVRSPQLVSFGCRPGQGCLFVISFQLIPPQVATGCAPLTTWIHSHLWLAALAALELDGEYTLESIKRIGSKRCRCHDRNNKPHRVLTPDALTAQRKFCLLFSQQPLNNCYITRNLPRTY